MHPPEATVVTVEAGAAEIREGDASGADFLFRRYGARLSEPLTVRFRVEPVPAAETNSLFAPLPGTVVFPAGATEVRVHLQPLADAVFEPDTPVTVTAEPADDYTVEPSRNAATILLLDDDPAPEPGPALAIASPAAGERLRADAPVLLRVKYRAEFAPLQDRVEYRVGERRFETRAPEGGLVLHLPAGTHEIAATAQLRDGQVLPTEPLSVTVEAAPAEPRVEILRPVRDTILSHDSSTGPLRLAVRARLSGIEGRSWQAVLRLNNGPPLATNFLDHPAVDAVEIEFPPQPVPNGRQALGVELLPAEPGYYRDPLLGWGDVVAVYVNTAPVPAPPARLSGDAILTTSGVLSGITSFNPAVMPPEVTRWVAGTAHTNFTALDQRGEWWDFSRGPRALSTAPRPPGVRRWRAIGGADNLRLGLGDDGQLYFWGRETRAEVPGLDHVIPPLGEAGGKVIPVWRPPGVTGWREAFASTDHYVALAEDGRLFVWGRGVHPPDGPPDATNRLGSLGEAWGPETQFPAAVPFPEGVTRWRACALGQRGAFFALGDDDRIYAWGEYGAGELAPTPAAPLGRRPLRLELPAGLGRPRALRSQASPYRRASDLLVITDSGRALLWSPAPGTGGTADVSSRPTWPLVLPPAGPGNQGPVSYWLDGDVSVTGQGGSGSLLGDDRTVYRFSRTAVREPVTGTWRAVTSLRLVSGSAAYSAAAAGSYQVRWLSPASGMTLTPVGLTLNVEVSPSLAPPNPPPAQVFLNGAYLMSAPGWPVTWRPVWPGPGPGRYWLQVRVFDAGGFNALSEPLEVVVPPRLTWAREPGSGTEPPALRLTTPAGAWSYVLESSPDLQVWQPRIVLPPDAATNLPLPAVPGAEFYRLRAVE